mgnify:FL=1
MHMNLIGTPATKEEFDAMFRAYREYFEEQLKAVCGSFCDSGAKYKALYDAAAYSLEAGGKRIRPVLAFEMCRVCGGDPSAALPAAIAIEMIHTFSLIHDDLPCMDNDDMRRGRPSCHKAHGEAVALLAGDALTAYAGKVICDSDLSAEKKAAMIQVLYDRTIGMIEGQTIDIDGNFDTLDGLLSMYEMKTSELLTAACVMGCIAAGADKEKISAATAYAHDLGLAFQIVDDILDVTSTAEELGKPIGSDEEQNKTTSVTLLGLDKARELAEKYTHGAENALTAFDDTVFLNKLTDLLLSRKK